MQGRCFCGYVAVVRLFILGLITLCTVSLARTSYRHCQVSSFPTEATHKAPDKFLWPGLESKNTEDDKRVEQEIS